MKNKRSSNKSTKRAAKNTRKAAKIAPKAGRKSSKRTRKSSKRTRKLDRQSAKPLVFISHKHKDKGIADVISQFLRNRSLNKVEIFQSSSASAKGPEIGKNLTQELKQNLRRASVVILVYTTSDQDWSYCTWECGIAMSPDTRIILFQCAADIPPIFQEQVRVDIRNSDAIQRFTKDFLTGTDFFPGRKEPISDFKEGDSDVSDAGKTFQEKLLSAAPTLSVTPIEEWSAFAFLRLELGQAQVDEISKARPSQLLRLTNDIRQKCLIRESDNAVNRIFDIPTIAVGSSFKTLVDKWRRRNPQSKSKWVEVLCGQMMDGAQGESIRLTWEPMSGSDDKKTYAPMVTRVRRIPNQGVQFDIYFYRFFAPLKKGKQLFLGARPRGKKLSS